MSKEALSTTCQNVLARVGLEFLVQGGPAFLADPMGTLIWRNQAWIDLARRFDPDQGWGTLSLPKPVVDLVAEQGGDVILDARIIGAGGGERISVRVIAAYDADGAICGAAGRLLTPTQAGTPGHHLVETRERLEEVTKLMSDWLWEVGPDLKLIYLSARVLEALGHHPRSLLGRPLTDVGRFVDAEGLEVRPPLSKRHPKPFRDHGFSSFDTTGRVRQFKLTGLPLFDPVTGAFGGYRGTAKDVTDEIRALAMVAHSQSVLTYAIESISEGFAIFDRDERLLLYNSKITEIYPRSRQYIKPGMSFRDMLEAIIACGDIPDGPAADLLRRESLTERARQVRGVEIELSDGRWIRATDRLTDDGCIVGVRADITELKQREKALIEARDVAQGANRAKSEFLANISHELRTPLNAIIGFTELILSEALGAIGNSHYREYLNDVLSSGRDLLDLINDIIELAKAESGQLDLTEEAVDAQDEIMSVVRALSERAIRGSITVMVEIAPGLPPILVDPRKLRQILFNLISNGIKFTRTGGVVTVSAAMAETGELALDVCDTGIGMAVKDLSTALKPFGQVDATLSRQYGGTGLGLPLTKALVERHGGTLAIASELNVGTRVSVRLPAHRLLPEPEG